ncbi:acyl carrier protein [Streptomyces sp. NPDC049577]|uniref:acyl carrier protein n=1 Tax=Streptomyces sp. NPDC049577 TaxID=3155153 RepID=UPI003443F6FB
MPTVPEQPTTYHLITEVLVHIFDLPEDELHPDATFHALGLDSLALAELAITVEEDTGCRLEDLTAEHTLAQAAEAVAARLAPAMAPAAVPPPAQAALEPAVAPEPAVIAESAVTPGAP